eukprot:GSMAST32.ASY1.ANO1.1159.1 assembled CDS
MYMMKSAYEIARDQRILENEAFLASLGIDSAKEKLGLVDLKSKPVKPKTKKKSKRKPKQPSRRSNRLKNVPADLTGLSEDLTKQLNATSFDPVDDARRERHRQAKYAKLMEKHAACGLKLPPAATYSHTVHRVLSMSQKALRTRIRVIERAQGQYACLKMRMFAEVLLLEEYPDLAKEAVEALDRLLVLPKFSKASKKNHTLVYQLAKQAD